MIYFLEEQFAPGNLGLLSGLNDADNDGDGSPDLEEFQRGSDPTDTDSDDASRCGASKPEDQATARHINNVIISNLSGRWHG